MIVGQIVGLVLVLVVLVGAEWGKFSGERPEGRSQKKKTIDSKSEQGTWYMAGAHCRIANVKCVVSTLWGLKNRPVRFDCKDLWGR